MPAKKKTIPMKSTGFRLEDVQIKNLKAEARKKKITPSEIVRECLDKRYSRKR